MSDLLFNKTTQPFPAEDIPEVIIDAEPEFSEFYNLAWKLAWEHVYESEHMPFSPYLSEGCGINKYIKNVRLEKAKELLLGSNMKVNEICRKVGYSNLSYFCKSFSDVYGVTPDKFRNPTAGN